MPAHLDAAEGPRDLRRLRAAAGADRAGEDPDRRGARLRPLTDPMRLNGCALIAVNAPAAAEPEIEAACAFVVEALGDPGGRARLWRP